MFNLLEVIMKRFVIFSVVMAVIFVSAVAFAANSRDGRRKFKTYCFKKCHSGKIENVKTITPNSYTSSQWLSIFSNNMQNLKKYHLNNELEDLNFKRETFDNIREYLKDHGLDSDTPETCA